MCSVCGGGLCVCEVMCVCQVVLSLCVCEVMCVCVMYVMLSLCVWSYCLWSEVCVQSVWRRAGERGGEGGAQDTESKTRTPYKDVGKNIGFGASAIS